MEFMQGFFAPWILDAVILLLHLALPARRVTGYVQDETSGALLRYRLNGPLVLVVTVGLGVLVCALGLFPWDWLYTHRWSGLAGSCALGLLFSFVVVLREPARGKPFLAELYLGRVRNRSFAGGRADAKMFLYLVGAVLLALNVLSFAAHHLAAYAADPSPGVILYAALFLWFVGEYLVFEQVHLYTYDIFAERVGFKLGWGCFTFYPYFYAVGLWFTADLPNPHAPTWALVVPAVLFFAGWSFSRGANLQKYSFKRDPDHALLGVLKPRALQDGTHALLASGFWGMARHVNYLGEILMAIGLTLALGLPGVWAAWLYPLYYVALLLPRERSDEKRCAAKYGALWDEYRRRVPRRIIPGIY
jgi:protein-S-isoprenylcysteine O-methyltransferase Ste14